MRICYVTEAGCSGELPSANSPVQPLLVIAGVALPAAGLDRINHGFAAWKARFFPGLTRGLPSPLDAILVDLRGTELRRLLRRSKREARFALAALHHLLDLLEAEDARLLGRIWIKGIDEPISRRAVFASSLQTISEALGHLCEKHGESAAIVADAAQRLRGEKLSQQIFARRWSAAEPAPAEPAPGESIPGGSADPLVRLVDLPTFGQRANHAGLQIAELLASGLLFPLAAHAFCRGHLQNTTHLSEGYAGLKRHFGGRLEKMQHRYADPAGKWRGGLVVSDLLGARPGGLLFR